MTLDLHHVTIARKFGFKPVDELTQNERDSVQSYCVTYYGCFDAPTIATSHWWKESDTGTNNWISYDCRQHNRMAAPHLKNDTKTT